MSLTLEQMNAKHEIEAAIRSHEANALEPALQNAVGAGLHEQLVEALITLAGANWHTRHEDVALALQQLRPARSVAALELLARARHAYLDYDEFYGLARKCTWALADIGTPEAKEALFRLVSTANPQVAAYATKRLDCWQQELHRKREV